MTELAEENLLRFGLGDRARFEKFVSRGVAIAPRPGKKDQKRSIVRASQPSRARARNSSSFPPLTSTGLPPPESPKPHNSPKVFAAGVSRSQSSQV
ncbi:hypothetical protein [Oscillatoria nigro-viridis]|uniref:hypothetical protein n=1 Tax=Phormidium nigroviride TaxID=482564 RepID=UPI0002F9E888|nr:hypothetical protein [Oscillatoria nigro-viridis]